MKIAIMQPYVFPYIGYFQLLKAVDKFIVYDDVTFIKGGWINRNRILLNGQPFLFTVPLTNVSSNNLIGETLISNKGQWNIKLLKTIEQAYKKAPHFEGVYHLIKKVISGEETTISTFAVKSLTEIKEYLGIKTIIQPTSKVYNNKHFDAESRLIDICKKENADHYINPKGGTELYSKQNFEAQGIRLNFIQSKPVEYKQLNNAFVPWLSIIDVLMFNSPEQTVHFINQYELV